ncbi:MAG: glycosyltransferase [Chitinophagaceae bacterium]|nr:glycosyltransferase [Chitinophagaceae bacterium]
MKKILWLASWYPDRLEPLSGDFIERHARSASLVNDITVIHVVKDHLNKTPSRQSIDSIEYHPHLTAIVGYYKSTSWLGPLSGLLSTARFFILQKKLIDQFIRQNGKPDLINVHISFKAGMGALYCKWRYKLPYVVSEQWTIFCPEASPNYNDQSFVAKRLMKMIYKKSAACSAVSNYLATALVQKFQIKLPIRIPNVVNRQIFYPSYEKKPLFTFVHVSVLNYQKSPYDIIEAVRLAHEKSAVPFRFIIYGPYLEAIYERISENNLGEIVDYRTEVMQDELAEEVRKCHSLVLYSRFETFGCVVIEAMAAGLPVIVSDIPVMREIVDEGITGTFAPVGQPSILAEKMLWMMSNHHLFNEKALSAASESYSYERVGKMFDELYEQPFRVSMRIA